MPNAAKNVPANGARSTAKNEYLARAFRLFSRGIPLKKCLRQNAAVSTSTVSAEMNQTIETIGTPVCKSYRAIAAKAAAMSSGQIRVGTSNNTDTSSAQPGQNGQIMGGLSANSPAS